MSEIPSDVLAAAKKAAYATEKNGTDRSAITSLNGVDVIAQAIMAERERCVRVALRYNYSAGDAHTMAAAIRSGAQS